MSAPYSIVNRFYEPIVTLDKGVSLEAAIAVAKDYRLHGGEPQATVHGDNYDVDCADGLSKAERDRVQDELG